MVGIPLLRLHEFTRQGQQMTTLPKRQYGDPLEVLIRIEEETCKGCRFRTVDRDGTARCKNPFRRQVLADLRCDDYEDNA
jgi:hypothetical protein